MDGENLIANQSFVGLDDDALKAEIQSLQENVSKVWDAVWFWIVLLFIWISIWYNLVSTQFILSQEMMKGIAPAHVPVAAPLRVSQPGGGAPSVPGGSEITKAFGLQSGVKKPHKKLLI